jgi:peptidoglycan/LPS O-acetylase OafA/YrhL
MNTRLLLAIAALLITNSHLEMFYPSRLLAGDGLLGNAIFFMVAGIGITLSARKKHRPFPEYYWRRIKRIYPTVLVVVTAFMLMPQRGWMKWSWKEFAQNYIYPTPWTFIEFVMVYYLIFYALLRFASRRVFGILFVAGFVVFAICWFYCPQDSDRLILGELHPAIYWTYWFQMMVLGAYLALRDRPITKSLGVALGLLIAVFVVYVPVKALFVTGRAAHFHFLLFPLVQIMASALVSVVETPALNAFLKRHPFAALSVNWIGRHTLEIYTVQGFVAHRQDVARLGSFPLNILAFCCVLFVLAWIVHKLARLITRERNGHTAVA